MNLTRTKLFSFPLSNSIAAFIDYLISMNFASVYFISRPMQIVAHFNLLCVVDASALKCWTLYAIVNANITENISRKWSIQLILHIIKAKLQMIQIFI